ncbi:MAG: chemotaxis protein CheW [Rhodocyclaceae bacterium]|nr:chemotaxis protein CheW [Rhodocyclaceae bacterium]
MTPPRHASAPSATTPATNACLGAGAHDQRWLFLPADTGQIIPVPMIVPVPFSCEWFAGLAAVRGQLYSVVDFSRFHGFDATPIGPSSRLLLFSPERQLHTALLFERIDGILSAERFHRAPPRPAISPWICEHWQDSADELWQQVDISALVNHPHFVESAAAVRPQQEAVA